MKGCILSLLGAICLTVLLDPVLLFHYIYFYPLIRRTRIKLYIVIIMSNVLVLYFKVIFPKASLLTAASSLLPASESISSIFSILFTFTSSATLCLSPYSFNLIPSIHLSEMSPSPMSHILLINAVEISGDDYIQCDSPFFSKIVGKEISI